MKSSLFNLIKSCQIQENNQRFRKIIKDSENDKYKIIMENTNSISNLADLLKSLQAQPTPFFVSLCARCGNDNQLMDNVLQKLQETYGQKLNYQKLVGDAAQLIKDELKISKNPVLLLISNGEIKAIFGGIIAQYHLEQALDKLGINTK